MNDFEKHRRRQIEVSKRDRKAIKLARQQARRAARAAAKLEKKLTTIAGNPVETMMLDPQSPPVETRG